MTRPGALESRVVASSSWAETVDGCWEEFVASLPTVVQEDARALPLVLRLTPRPLPWSRIFHQEVTLALPLTLSEALPHATPLQVETAVRAHMFGIIAAFGADRLDDGQVEPTPRLLQLLDDVRFVRDSAIDAFGTATPTPTYDFRAADVATAQANRLEQDFLARNASADFGTYERLSVGKQWLVFPAAMTFARACGFDDVQLQHLETMCLAMAMGLQLRDDATDWEDDHAEGRAWAVRLLRHAEGTHERDMRDDVNALRAHGRDRRGGRASARGNPALRDRARRRVGARGAPDRRMV